MYNGSLLLKYYFESDNIYKWRYFRQTLFNQLNVMVSYVDIIGQCHIVALLWEIYVMRRTCDVRGLRFSFKRMLITGLNRLWKYKPKCVLDLQLISNSKKCAMYRVIFLVLILLTTFVPNITIRRCSSGTILFIIGLNLHQI